MLMFFLLTVESSAAVVDTREELDFMLDEEMEELNLQKRSFAKYDSDSEDEITDADIRKIIIVTQVRDQADRTAF